MAVVFTPSTSGVQSLPQAGSATFTCDFIAGTAFVYLNADNHPTKNPIVTLDGATMSVPWAWNSANAWLYKLDGISAGSHTLVINATEGFPNAYNILTGTLTGHASSTPYSQVEPSRTQSWHNPGDREPATAPLVVPAGGKGFLFTHTSYDNSPTPDSNETMLLHAIAGSGPWQLSVERIDATCTPTSDGSGNVIFVAMSFEPAVTSSAPVTVSWF